MKNISYHQFKQLTNILFLLSTNWLLIMSIGKDYFQWNTINLTSLFAAYAVFLCVIILGKRWNTISSEPVQINKMIQYGIIILFLFFGFLAVKKIQFVMEMSANPLLIEGMPENPLWTVVAIVVSTLMEIILLSYALMFLPIKK